MARHNVEGDVVLQLSPEIGQLRYIACSKVDEYFCTDFKNFYVVYRTSSGDCYATCVTKRGFRHSRSYSWLPTYVLVKGHFRK